MSAEVTSVPTHTKRQSARWAVVGRGIAIAVTVLFVAVFGAKLLFTPVQGSVLVLLSARTGDRVQASSIELRSTSGRWIILGAAVGGPVPAAPNTTTVLQASAPVGNYDSIRFGGQSLTANVEVRRQILATLLIAIASGKPVMDGVYSGSEGVSLGLNELSGQLKPMPIFSLVDQFGRSFSNVSIAGHEVILAAFHTTCRETCPLYTGLFMKLRAQLPAQVLLIETTTDPAADTPDVLRRYAGRIGASWTFLTGDPTALTAFWKPFNVELSSSDVHRSELALIDSHGYIRTYYMGVPDVGGNLPESLLFQLSPDGRQLLYSHGNGWGQAQVLDSLHTISALAPAASGGHGSAPGFTLSTLDGRRVSLGDFQGRPLLINFWATWCVPCRAEMPLIERTASTHPKLTVLLVNERDDPSAARAFVAELGLHSRVLLDGDGRVGDLYEVSGLPTTIFVRADGTVEDRYLGQMDEQALSRHLAAIGV